MTREEFFARRAIMHHLKTKGVTVCPPGGAATSSATFRPFGGGGPVTNTKRVKAATLQFALRYPNPHIDDDGVPVIRTRKY